MEPFELSTFKRLQGMAAPVFNGEYAGRGASDKHGLAIQIKSGGAIFRNIGKRRDSNFHSFSVLE
jgi:hypothetical protein